MVLELLFFIGFLFCHRLHITNCFALKYLSVILTFLINVNFPLFNLDDRETSIQSYLQLQRSDHSTAQSADQADNSDYYSLPQEHGLSRHPDDSMTDEHLIDCPPLFIHLTASILSSRNNLPVGDIPVCLRKHPDHAIPSLIFSSSPL